jgi:RNA-binding protein YhbY
MNIAKFQIGKLGVTRGVVESLALTFKNHKQVRISVLKASGRNRENIKEMAEKLCKDLAVETKARYEPRIIGFTIVLIKAKK